MVAEAIGRLRTAARREPGTHARQPTRRSAGRRRLRHRSRAGHGPQRL